MSPISLPDFTILCLAWMGVGVVVFGVLFFVTAPFGRHSSNRWGPTIPNRAGWIIMELPSLTIMIWYLLMGSYSLASYAWILFGCWILHYANRTLIYPFRIHTTSKRIPLLIVACAIGFNLMNAGLNGYYLANLAPPEAYGLAWLASPLFWIGAVLFVTGLVLNWRIDTYLIGLRSKKETGYVIPRGGLFELVAAPNLLAEIIEWLGFALMAWNLPALCFLVWTLANLVPRAKNHLDWYRGHFPDWPAKRKAIFPWLF